MTAEVERLEEAINKLGIGQAQILQVLHQLADALEKLSPPDSPPADPASTDFHLG